MKALDLKKTYGTGTASCYEKYFPRFNSKAYRTVYLIFSLLLRIARQYFELAIVSFWIRILN